MVRANYSNRSKGVSATRRYLDMFFDNLLLGGDHELRNRFMHVDFERAAKAPAMKKGVGRLLEALGEDELSAREIMETLGLSDRGNFMKAYLNPALEQGLVERTIPDKPNSRMQRYRRVKRLDEDAIYDPSAFRS